VEIPEEIRARAAVNGFAPGSNGSAPDSDSDSEEGGMVVTPPGAGGDVHGAPPIGGTETPTPPDPGSAGPT
jgi:cell division protease FtsH